MHLGLRERIGRIVVIENYQEACAVTKALCDYYERSKHLPESVEEFQYHSKHLHQLASSGINLY